MIWIHPSSAGVCPMTVDSGRVSELGELCLGAYKGCDVWMRSRACFDSWRAETGTGVVWMDMRQALWLYPLSAWWSCHPMLKGYLLSKSAGARDFNWHNPGKEMEKWEGLSHSELIFLEEKLWTLLWALLIFVECYEEERLWNCNGVTVHGDSRWHVAAWVSQCAADKTIMSEIWRWLIAFSIFLPRVKCFKEFCGRATTKWSHQFLSSVPNIVLVSK